MMKRIVALTRKLHDQRVLRYLAAGAVTAMSEYGSFAFLTLLIPNILINNAISFVISLFVGFTLNKFWVFKSTGNYRRQASGYLTLSVVNLGIGSLLIVLFAEVLDFHPLWAKLFTMAIIAASNYLLFSRLIFRPKE